MYRVFELTETGDAVLRGEFESEQEALDAATALVSYQVEVDLGWGSRIIRKVILESC